MRNIFAFLVIIGLILFIGNHTTKANPTTAATSYLYLPMIMGGSGFTQQQQDILNLVNAERAKVANCPALKLNPKLNTAAALQSDSMGKQNYFSHTNPNPGLASLSNRIDSVGYAWSAIGENIAAGNPTAQGVMQSWMNSAGHRANILNCNYTDLGVAYYYDANDTFGPYFHYWTQVFARAR